MSKIEKAGLITRIQSEADRRTMEIVLTDTGKILAEEAVEQRRKRHEEMFLCLTPEEQSFLYSLLEKLSEDWKDWFMLSQNCRRHGYHGKNIHAAEDGEE